MAEPGPGTTIAALLLAGVLSPLLLAAGNPGEWRPQDLLTLVGLVSGTGAGLTLLRRLLWPRLDPWRGLGIDLVLIALLTLPLLVARSIAPLLPAGMHLRQRLVLPGSLALASLALVGLARTVNPRRLVGAGLAALLAMDLLLLGRVGLQGVELERALRSSPTARRLLGWNADSAAAGQPAGPRPDVFVLILDAYAGDSLLAAEYRMDHRAHRAALDSLGFLPATGILSNYAHTFASVASFLNFAHLAPVGTEPLARSQHPGVFYALIHRNRTVRLFQAMGYDVHWFPAPLFATRSLPPAGATVHRAPVGFWKGLWLYAPLVQSWLETVFTPSVVARAFGASGLVPTGTTAPALAELPRFADDRKPSLVVLHLMATHHPYHYAEDCSVDPGIERTLADSLSYPLAVRCLDRQLRETFRGILAASRGEAIIVAVGDHAPSSLGAREGDRPAEHVPPAVAAGRFDATVAIYLPPSLRAGFAMPRSEVNLIPALLRSAFGMRLADEPDTRFYSRLSPFPIYRFVPLP